MGAVRRGYARRFGTAADAYCALRRLFFGALILPARLTERSGHASQPGVLLCFLPRRPGQVSYGAS